MWTKCGDRPWENYEMTRLVLPSRSFQAEAQSSQSPEGNEVCSYKGSSPRLEPGCPLALQSLPH